MAEHMWYERAQELEAENARLRAELAAERERAEEAQEWQENYKRAADIAHADLNAALAKVAKLREALAIFLGHDDRFQVAVAGNDIAVDKMLNAARAVLDETKGDGDE